MIKILSALILTAATVIAASASGDAGPYDWKLNYEFEVTNPLRKLLQVKAEFTFPTTTGEVTFQLDDYDNHYTEGYRRYLRAFTLKDSDGNDVEFITDTLGLYRASGLKGTYNSQYIIVMEHITRAQSKLGPDDTPIMWGHTAIFPGAAVVVYPSGDDGARIGDIKIGFKLFEGASFIAPYEQIDESSYRVPSLSLLRSEFWAVGEFDKFVFEKDGDSLVCGISRGSLRYGEPNIRPKIESVLGFYSTLFGSMPVHKLTMTVIATPSSGRVSGFHSYGSVGSRSFSCLIDEKVGADDLGAQMGLIVYNVLAFWTPNHFRPASLADLDWFTTATLNYMQLKTMLKLGFTDDAEFLGNLGRAYTTYRDQLSRKGLSLSVLNTLPNSSDRSVYGFMICAMLDLMLQARTNGESGLENILHALNVDYGGTSGYTTENLYALLREAGIPEIDSLIDTHVKSAGPIDLGEILKPYGLATSLEPSSAPDIGLRVKDEENLTVEWIEPGGPAQKAGLEFGDVLSEVRGFKMNQASDLPKLVSDLSPGKTIDVVYVRNGEKRKAKIQIGSRMHYTITRTAAATEKTRELWDRYRAL